MFEKILEKEIALKKKYVSKLIKINADRRIIVIKALEVYQLQQKLKELNALEVYQLQQKLKELNLK